jgi:hypothetical protein
LATPAAPAEKEDANPPLTPAQATLLGSAKPPPKKTGRSVAPSRTELGFFWQFFFKKTRAQPQAPPHCRQGPHCPLFLQKALEEEATPLVGNACRASGKGRRKPSAHAGPCNLTRISKPPPKKNRTEGSSESDGARIFLAIVFQKNTRTERNSDAARIFWHFFSKKKLDSSVGSSSCCGGTMLEFLSASCL